MFWAFGQWAVGSEQYINEALLALAPWMAAWGIYTRRYSLAAAAYAGAALALITSGWGPISVSFALVHFLVAGLSLWLWRAFTNDERA
jgi:hypothetical protein